MCTKPYTMEDKANYYKSLFITYCDGGYEIDANPNVPTTYQMGVCKLEYIEKKNKLIVYLRRPGLLIGKAGHTLDTIKEYLKCEIAIVETNLMLNEEVVIWQWWASSDSEVMPFVEKNFLDFNEMKTYSAEHSKLYKKEYNKYVSGYNKVVATK